jgi:hypothetical protein
VRLDTDELHELEPSVQRRLFLGKVLMAQAPRCIIVSQGFRNMIEEARLSGPTFPAQVIFVGGHAERISEKYWVMDANTVAPPMAKELKKFADDEPYQYTEAALATIGNIDCAIRFEHRDCWRFMICSQKFYQLFRRAKVAVECRPIIAVKG